MSENNKRNEGLQDYMDLLDEMAKKDAKNQEKKPHSLKKGTGRMIATVFVIFFQNCRNRCNFPHRNCTYCLRGFYEGCNNRLRDYICIPSRRNRYWYSLLDRVRSS